MNKSRFMVYNGPFFYVEDTLGIHFDNNGSSKQ